MYAGCGIKVCKTIVNQNGVCFKAWQSSKMQPKTNAKKPVTTAAMKKCITKLTSRKARI